MLFQVYRHDGSIVIVNGSDKTILVKEVRLTIETTVITPEERLSIRKISDEIKLNSRLKPGEKIEVKTYYTNVTAVSVVFESEGVVQREDHEL